MDTKTSKSNGYLKAVNPAFHNFITQIPQKLHNCIKLHINKLAKYEEETNSESPIPVKKVNTNCNAFEVNLEKQLHAWRNNPVWVDQPPEVKVSVPKGSLCNLYVKVNVGLPPDAVYNIVIDPDNKRVFKNIQEVVSRKVLVDEGSRQLVEVEQAALWRFLWWSGTIPIHVLVDQNRDDYSMKFKQAKTGFMKKFEGSWRVEPLFVDEELCLPSKPTTLSDYCKFTKEKGRVGSVVRLDQLIQPAIVPPPPISWYLMGITAKTTEMLINDLLAEAAAIREGRDSDEQTLEFCHEECVDIKERWAMRRRSVRRNRRKVSGFG